MFLLSKFSPIVESVCTATTTQIFAQARTIGFKVYGSGKRVGTQFAYRPGKVSTSPLVVCHADTVENRGTKGHVFAWRDTAKTIAESIALDDRLGIAAMFYGIQCKSFLRDCAMLICNDEETGQSSAQVFDLPVTPNYLIELDRRGDDVVCYEYDSPLLRSLLKSVGFRIGSGSFSDICYLERLGVVGFNVGIGYHNEHSHKCHANIQDTLDQLARLSAFHSRFGHIRLEHDPFFADDRYSYRYSKPKGSLWGAAKVSTTALDPDFLDFATDDIDEDSYKFGDDIFYEPKIGKDWNRRIDF